MGKWKLEISTVSLVLIEYFLQKCLLNSSPHLIRLLSELLNLIGFQGNKNTSFSKKICFSRTIRRLKVCMVFATSLAVFLLLCYCIYFDETFTVMLLVFHCCGYTWAIVR